MQHDLSGRNHDKFFVSSIITWLLFFMPSVCLAQNPPQNSPCIKLTTEPDSYIDVRIGCTEETPVWIERRPGQIASYTLPANELTLIELDDVGGEVKIYGNIEIFSCKDNRNRLHDIDLSEAPQLISLNCATTDISKLDFSNTPSLRYLNCDRTKISVLDVTMLPEIKEITAVLCRLSSLKMKDNKKLTALYVNSTGTLGNIDLSQCPNLEILQCWESGATSINLKETPNLKGLACSDNQLSEIDLSGVKNLETLDVARTGLTSLDVTNNPELLLINCQSNQISELNLSNNHKLRRLACRDNKIKELKIDDLPNLYDLSASDNLLSGTYKFNNINIGKIAVDGNNIQSIQVNNCPNLTEFSAYGNSLDNRIDFVNCPLLRRVNIGNNKLSGMSTLSCDSIESISLIDNLMDACALDELFVTLNSLVLKTNTDKILAIKGNPGASTSKTDVAKGKHWWVDVKGDGSGCDTPIELPSMQFFTSSPEDTELTVYTKIDDNEPCYIDWGDGSHDQELKNGELKGTLKGSYISFYGNLSELEIKNAGLYNAVISKGDKLQRLNLDENNFEVLSITNLENLNHLSIQHNRIKDINFTGLPALKSINLSYNDLGAYRVPDFTAAPNLERLEISDNNRLLALYVDQQLKLEYLDASNCKLQELVFNAQVPLKELKAENNQIGNWQMIGHPTIEKLNLSNNYVGMAEIARCPMLKEICMKDNATTSMKIEELPMLNNVDLRNSELTADILDMIYTNLPTTSNGYIYVAGIKEAPNSFTSIATDKGWIIDVKGKETSVNDIEKGKIKVKDLSDGWLITAQAGDIIKVYNIEGKCTLQKRMKTDTEFIAREIVGNDNGLIIFQVGDKFFKRMKR